MNKILTQLTSAVAGGIIAVAIYDILAYETERIRHTKVLTSREIAETLLSPEKERG